MPLASDREGNMRKIILVIGTCVAAGLTGCATRGSGLDAMLAGERHELYTRCVDAQMKHVSFGSGMAVHQECLKWARSRIQRAASN